MSSLFKRLDELASNIPSTIYPSVDSDEEYKDVLAEWTPGTPEYINAEFELRRLRKTNPKLYRKIITRE